MNYFIFDNPVQVENFKTKELFTIEKNIITDRLEIDAMEISNICNQPLIYNLLFKKMFLGNEYTKENGKGFIQWCDNGWKTNEFYVFVIRNKNRKIVGCIDIKSNNTDETEIGYWLDQNYSGVMTNTIKEILIIARNNKYKKIIADVELGNKKSVKILEKNMFAFEKHIDGYIRYNKFI